MTKPTVGRIVHYRDDAYPTEHNVEDEVREVWNAALVVAVRDDGTLNLVVWDEYGNDRAVHGVSEGERLHHWRWPPRV